jgi:SM-20-related protein
LIRLKHLILDEFLSEAERDSLLEFALGNESGFVPSKLKGGEDGRYDPASRNSLICETPLGLLKDRFTAAILGRLEELFAGTGTSPFPVARFEIELAAHRDGCFFTTHQDTFTGAYQDGLRSDRLISIVYYFHARPRGFSGGELAIYPFDRGDPDLIEPADNRLVAFPSIAHHEVRPILCRGGAFEEARFSINCWLRRKRSAD